jgi:hypothetical protein
VRLWKFAEFKDLSDGKQGGLKRKNTIEFQENLLSTVFSRIVAAAITVLQS